jgi:hypothetical protein
MPNYKTKEIKQRGVLIFGNINNNKCQKIFLTDN